MCMSSCREESCYIMVTPEYNINDCKSMIINFSTSICIQTNLFNNIVSLCRQIGIHNNLLYIKQSEYHYHVFKLTLMLEKNYSRIKKLRIIILNKQTLHFRYRSIYDKTLGWCICMTHGRKYGYS